VLKKFIYGALGLFLAFIIIGALLPEPAQEEVADTEQPAVQEGTRSGDFIQDKLGPLVNSVAASVDTNWQFYFVEPVQRLAEGGDLEEAKADLELLVNLLKGEKKKLEGLEIPDGLEEAEKVRDELVLAIDKRIEAVQALLAIEDRQEAANLDVESLIVESNEHLTRAASAYKELSK